MRSWRIFVAMFLGMTSLWLAGYGGSLLLRPTLVSIFLFSLALLMTLAALGFAQDDGHYRKTVQPSDGMKEPTDGR